MNKKAQTEFSAWGMIYAIVGLVISVVITKLMNASWFWKIVTIVVVTGVCYAVGWKASSQ